MTILRLDNVLRIEGARLTPEKKASAEAELKQTRLDVIEHQNRDANNRKYLYTASDFFRSEENRNIDYTRKSGQSFPTDWNAKPWSGNLFHHDDTSKVDIPYVARDFSDDITKFRVEVHAEVSSVSEKAFVYSHGVGGGAKNASSLFQFMLENRLLECSGQSILFIAADCASAGRNLITAVSGPAYFVQNGLADCVVMIFMENLHSKWLSDQFFGQFTRLFVLSCPFGFYAEVSSDPAPSQATLPPSR